MGRKLRVALVGAGPWAKLVHAPMLAAGPETELAGVWARRPEAATALAAAHAVPAFDRYADLLAGCEAVSFAVAPAAQAELAPLAAAAGKALLLEKPLADALPGAERLAAAVAAAGVPSMIFLTSRFLDAARTAIDAARAAEPFAARIAWISGAFLPGSPFAFGWRLQRGPLLDVGPHALDIALQLFGPIARLKAAGSPAWCSLLAEHHNGAISEIALTASAGGGARSTELQVVGPAGVQAFDLARGADGSVFANVRAAFAATVRGERADLPGAAHGLTLQRLLAEAETALQ